MSLDQLPLGVDHRIHEAVRAERDELRAQVVDEIAAGERQAAINVELMRLLEVVCDDCRSIIDETMREVA